MNHLWQSTLFTVAMGLLTLALRNNRAPVRYWLWFAASVKFLIPFSLLVTLGSQLEWRKVPVLTPLPMMIAMHQVSLPLPVSTSEQPAGAGQRSSHPRRSDVFYMAMWLLCGRHRVDSPMVARPSRPCATHRPYLSICPFE